VRVVVTGHRPLKNCNQYPRHCWRDRINSESASVSTVIVDLLSSSFLERQWLSGRSPTSLSTRGKLFRRWSSPRGRPRDFFQGWALRGSEARKSPIVVRGQSPDGGLAAKPPCWRHILKILHKYFVYWDFRQQHLQHKKYFATFPGGTSDPLAHACGCPWLSRLVYETRKTKNKQYTETLNVLTKIPSIWSFLCCGR